MEDNILVCFLNYDDYFLLNKKDCDDLRMLALELNLPLYFFGMRENSENLLFNFKNI